MECSIKEDVIEVPSEVIHHRCHSLTQKSRNFLQSLWSFRFRLCQREIVFTVSTTQKHTIIQIHSPYRLLWFLMSAQSGLIWIQTDIPLFSSRTTAASWVNSQLTPPWLEKEFSSEFCPLVSIWVPLSSLRCYSILTKTLLLWIFLLLVQDVNIFSVKVDKWMPLLCFLLSFLGCIWSQFINADLSRIAIELLRNLLAMININVNVIVDWQLNCHI